MHRVSLRTASARNKSTWPWRLTWLCASCARKTRRPALDRKPTLAAQLRCRRDGLNDPGRYATPQEFAVAVAIRQANLRQVNLGQVDLRQAKQLARGAASPGARPNSRPNGHLERTTGSTAVRLIWPRLLRSGRPAIHGR